MEKRKLVSRRLKLRERELLPHPPTNMPYVEPPCIEPDYKNLSVEDIQRLYQSEHHPETMIALWRAARVQ